MLNQSLHGPSRLVRSEELLSKRSIRRVVFIVVGSISVLAFASCDWTQFRLVASHSGDSQSETAISTSNVSSLALRFTAGNGGDLSSPAVAGGVVYVGSVDGNLYAFDAAGNTDCSGTPKACAPLWTGSTSTGNVIQSSPAVNGGVVYVGGIDGKLYAFDASGNTNCSGMPKNCAPLWTATTGNLIFSSPAVVNGVVYIGSGDGNLYAFDASGNTNCSGTPKTCAPLWTAATGPIIASPAVSNGIVYVGPYYGNGNLFAFDAAGNTNCSGLPKTCAPLWTYASGDVVSSPAVVGGAVYVGGTNATVYAFDAAGNTNCLGTPKVCAPLWSTGVNSNEAIFSSPAVADGTVYIGDQCNAITKAEICNNPPHFFAFDAANGVQRWESIGTSWPVKSSPAVANGVVFVGSLDGNIYAFDANGNIDCSGFPKYCSPLWTANTGSVDSSPAIANGTVYVEGGGGNLYAFGLPK